MGRRAFLGTLAGGFLAVPLAAQAQTAGKVPRVGVLALGVAPSQSETANHPFWVAMRELGWVNGQTMVVEQRYGKSADQLDFAAAELVRLKVDLIVTFTGSAAGAARKETQTVPIVMTASGDAVRQGLIASLAQPGGNVTGLTAISYGLSRKRLELLRETVPKLARLGALGCGSGEERAQTQTAAQVLGIQLVSVDPLGCSLSESRTQSECLDAIPPAFALATRQRVQAIVGFDCAHFNTTAVTARIVDLATRTYPTSSDSRQLMSIRS